MYRDTKLLDANDAVVLRPSRLAYNPMLINLSPSASVPEVLSSYAEDDGVAPIALLAITVYLYVMSVFAKNTET